MAKYVKYWNVGGGMKANAYYGSKFLTRRKRKMEYSRKPSDFEINLVSAFVKGVLIIWAILVIGLMM